MTKFPRISGRSASTAHVANTQRTASRLRSVDVLTRIRGHSVHVGYLGRRSPGGFWSRQARGLGAVKATLASNTGPRTSRDLLVCVCRYQCLHRDNRPELLQVAYQSWSFNYTQKLARHAVAAHTVEESPPKMTATRFVQGSFRTANIQTQVQVDAAQSFPLKADCISARARRGRRSKLKVSIY